MGACGSKPKVRGDGEDAPAHPCVPTSSTCSNLDRSGPNPPVGCSLAGNPTSLSPIPVEHPAPAPTTRAKENVEGGGDVRKVDDKETSEGNGLLENNNAQLELPKQKSIPIENSQFDLKLESMKPEPMKTHVESTKPEPVKTPVESKKPQIPKPALSELPSKEIEIKLLDSEIKLLESAARTLSKKAEQGGISLLPDRTPNESETKLLASLATPENKTPQKESESKSKAIPELVKQESQREREKHKSACFSKESTWNGMSCASSRQASIDFLDASDKMVIDRGVLESMSVIPDTMKAELERAVEEPITITSTKSVKDWNAKMEKIESFDEAKKEKESITGIKMSENNIKDKKLENEKEKDKEKENTLDNVNETPKQIGVNIRYPK